MNGIPFSEPKDVLVFFLSRIGLFGLALALSLAGVGRAEAPPAILVVRTYSIADLIIPVEDCSISDIFSMPKVEVAWKAKAWKAKTPPALKCDQNSDPKRSDHLMNLIASKIEPESWVEKGGQGKMEYQPEDMLLHIQQTPANHERIAALLKSLGPLEGLSVQLEVRCLRISDRLLQRIAKNFGLDQPVCPVPAARDRKAERRDRPVLTVTENLVSLCSKSAPPITTTEARVTFLSAYQSRLLLKAVQEDSPFNFMKGPVRSEVFKGKVFDGQTASLNNSEVEFFVRDNGMAFWHGSVVYCPQNEPFEVGLKLIVKPVVSADRKSVRLELKTNLTNVEITPSDFLSEEALTPIGLLPMYVQDPRFVRLVVNDCLSVPDGGTVMLSGQKTTREVPNEFLKSLVKAMPHVEKVFDKVGKRQATEQHLILITPRVIPGENASAGSKAQIKPGAVQGLRTRSSLQSAPGNGVWTRMAQE